MSDQEESFDVLTRLLEDKVPEEDAFGGHKKVADAIYGLIYDEKEGGKAIALSGSFGSGKSTVVDFLKRKFNKEEEDSKKETKIFVFDAWEHQGDSLRRAFVEKYREFFEGSWMEEGKFEKDIEKISKHREEIKTTIRPNVTKEGLIFAFSLLLEPLGISLVNTNLLGNIIGFIFVLFTIFYALYLLVFYDKKKRKSLFNIFLKRPEDSKTQRIKTPAPTSIEFQ